MHERWQQRRAHFSQPGHGPRALSFPWTFVYPLPPTAVPQLRCAVLRACSAPAVFPLSRGVGGEGRGGEAKLCPENPLEPQFSRSP